MKYTSYTKVVFTLVLLNLSGYGFSQSALGNYIARAAARAIHTQQAAVKITATLKKPQTMQDLMCRPIRYCKDQVISYVTKTSRCQGTLDLGSNRVYMPANCVQKDGYTLESVSLTFANGRTVSNRPDAIEVSQEIAFVRVKPEVIQGLNGLPFAFISDETN